MSKFHTVKQQPKILLPFVRTRKRLQLLTFFYNGDVKLSRVNTKRSIKKNR